MDWNLRLMSEYKTAPWTWFVTLTYDNDNLPFSLDDYPILRKHLPADYDPVTLCTRDAQLFIKRLRKLNKDYTDLQMRYYLCGEYGERYGRPHYHIALFNCHPDAANQIHATWGKGIVDVQICTNASSVFSYVASYIVTAFATTDRKNKRPFSLMSRRPYLGHDYVNTMREYHRKLNEPFLRIANGKTQRLPRIFREKIWNTEILDPKTGQPKQKYNPPSTWKETALDQEYYRYWDEVHRQLLLTGKWGKPDLINAEEYLEYQKVYHENQLRTKAKINDKL